MKFWTEEQFNTHIANGAVLYEHIAEVANIIKDYSDELHKIKWKRPDFTTGLEYEVLTTSMEVYEGEDNDYQWDYRAVQFPVECLFSQEAIDKVLKDMADAKLREEERKRKEREKEQLRKEKMKENSEYQQYLELKKKFERSVDR